MLMKSNQLDLDGSALRAPKRSRLDFFTRLVMTLEAYVQHRRQRHELLALDDHMLKDIGISRAEATRIAGQPFNQIGGAGRAHHPL
ncbi:MAG: DUF1127 domain-containing protein [Rhodomicrobiaceae bacterium]